MKPLKTTQRVLIWFSALDVGKKEPSWKRLAFIAFSSSACLGNIASTLASAAFVWINLATDLEGSLYALLQFCGKFFKKIYLLFNINCIFSCIAILNTKMANYTK